MKSKVLEIIIDPKKLISQDTDANGMVRILVKVNHDDVGSNMPIFLSTYARKEGEPTHAKPSLAGKYIVIGNNGGISLK